MQKIQNIWLTKLKTAMNIDTNPCQGKRAGRAQSKNKATRAGPGENGVEAEEGCLLLRQAESKMFSLEKGRRKMEGKTQYNSWGVERTRPFRRNKNETRGGLDSLTFTVADRGQTWTGRIRREIGFQGVQLPKGN